MLRALISKYHHVIASLALILLFFHPIFFAAQTFFFRDIHRWFYPMKHFLGTAFTDGHLPLWNPYYFCGSPFMSDIQSGVFYPLSLLFGLLPFPFAYNLFTVVHVFLGGQFFYLFIRRIGFSRSAALVTSVSFAFGGCTLSAINVLNNLSTLVWLPAVLWSFQWAVDKGLKKAFPLPVFCLVCAVLGGEPQLFLFIAGMLLLFAFASPDGGPIRTRLALGGAALLVIIAAVGATLFQVGPQYIDYLHSVRQAGLPFEEVVANSLPIAALKHLVMPLVFPADFATAPNSLVNFFPGTGQLPWILSIYPGFLIVPLAIYGLFSGQFKSMRVYLLLTIVALLLALGDNTPLYRPFYTLLPFFRFPEKLLFISNFCLLVMAAPGVDALLQRLQKRGLRPALVGGLLASILVADLYLSHRYLNPLIASQDYTYHDPDVQPILDDPSLFRVFVDARQLPGQEQPQTIMEHHARWQFSMMPNLGVIHDLPQVGGKTGLELKYQYFITEILSKPWSQKMLFLKMANVKYILSRHPLAEEPALNEWIEPVTDRVYRIKSSLPRAWLVGRIRAASESSMKHILNHDFNPANTAIGGADLAASHQVSHFALVDAIAAIGNRVRIEVNARLPAVLILAESAYPGWKVYVDGTEKEIQRLNIFFQGVAVDAGYHTVEFVFFPEKIVLFTTLSVITFVLCLGVWISVFNLKPTKLISH